MVLKHINLACKSPLEMYKSEEIVEHLKNELKLDDSTINDTLIFLEELGLIKTYVGVGLNITDRGKTSSLYGIDIKNFKSHCENGMEYSQIFNDKIIGSQSNIIIPAINQKIINTHIDSILNQIENLNLEKESSDKVVDLLKQIQEEVSTDLVESSGIKKKTYKLFDLIHDAGNHTAAVNALYDLGIIVINF